MRRHIRLQFTDLLYLPAFIFYGMVHVLYRFVVWFVTDTTAQDDDPGL